MSQIFHRSANTLSRVSIFGALFIIAGLVWLAMTVSRSSYATGAQVVREQPIQFSHMHHVQQVGIDCRYCPPASSCGPCGTQPRGCEISGRATNRCAHCPNTSAKLWRPTWRRSRSNRVWHAADRAYGNMWDDSTDYLSRGWQTAPPRVDRAHAGDHLARIRGSLRLAPPASIHRRRAGTPDGRRYGSVT